MLVMLQPTRCRNNEPIYKNLPHYKIKVCQIYIYAVTQQVVRQSALS